MIDFDELDEADINVRLRHVFDKDASAAAFAKAVEKLESEEDADSFSQGDPFARAAEEKRPVLRPGDIWEAWPASTLAVVVPFREDASGRRTRQLGLFARHLREKLAPALPMQLRLVVVEQSASGAFNRGKLLNIGARWCKAFLAGDVIFCPHDVDMLPEPSLAPYYTHLRGGHCVHVGWVNRKYDYPTFFGGACCLMLQCFLASGGFPNEFWGWGREDDVLHARLRVIADTKVLVPEAESGIVFQDEPETAGERTAPRWRSENRVFRQHLLGTDNIFDPPSFEVLDHEERGWMSHLLVGLRPPDESGSGHPQDPGASRGASALALALMAGS